MDLKLGAAAFTFAAGLAVASSGWAAASLPGGQITLAALSGPFKARAVTDAAGARFSRNVPPGAYKLTVVLDAKDPQVKALAADVYVEIDVNGKQVSCTRANLSTGAAYNVALLVEGAADLPVVVHLAPRPAPAAPAAVAAIPPRRGVID